MTTPPNASSTPASAWLPIISAIAPGPHTRPLPTTGRMANTMVTTPQNTAFGSPVSQNPSPTRLPWIAAVRPVPTIVAVVTSRNRWRSFSVFLAENGMYGRAGSPVSWGRRSRENTPHREMGGVCGGAGGAAAGPPARLGGRGSRGKKGRKGEWGGGGAAGGGAPPRPRGGEPI